MPFNKPIEVMPICMVDRKCVGSALSRIAAAASLSPPCACASSRERRAVSSATSDIAKKPLSRISDKTISMSILSILYTDVNRI